MKPKRTLKSVIEELVKGLQDGSVVLRAKRRPRANCPAWPGCACIVRGRKDVDCMSPYGSNVMSPDQIEANRKRRGNV
jgi:hypothetical protein